jgi:hypothetical protein
MPLGVRKAPSMQEVQRVNDWQVRQAVRHLAATVV